jgi:hypothetical protein
MHIPAYKIHNVLSTYSLQLYKEINPDPHSKADPNHHAPKNQAAPEIRRQAVIDKVAADVMQRITHLDAPATKRIVCTPSSIPADSAENKEIQNNLFIFNSLDIHNVKTSQCLSVEDSIFSINRDNG